MGRLWSKLAKTSYNACAMMEVWHQERKGVIIREHYELVEWIRRLTASSIVDELEERTEKEVVQEIWEMEDAHTEEDVTSNKTADCLKEDRKASSEMMD